MAKQGNDWKAYDGRALKDGEVLVPQLVTQEYARSLGAEMENLRIWSKGGVHYFVMFVAVPEAQEELGWTVFNQEVNELLNEKLGPVRTGREEYSLDALGEWGFEARDRRFSPESFLIEEYLLEALIQEAERVNPLFRDVIRLGWSGLARSEIIGALPVKKSQAYDLVRKCREAAKEFLKKGREWDMT